jgi:hypothetical protein
MVAPPPVGLRTMEEVGAGVAAAEALTTLEVGIEALGVVRVEEVVVVVAVVDAAAAAAAGVGTLTGRG